MAEKKIRRNIDQATNDELMFRNRHTCCICHDSSKHVQIHHIDGDPSNNEINNLAVICLFCHSRVSSNEGLGRRFTPGEISKYKREWESSNLSKLVRKSEIDDIEASTLKANISKLTVEAISLTDRKRKLEALAQIESYYVYFGMQNEALEAITTILWSSVFGDSVITADCAERIHHFFWGLPEPEYISMEPKDEEVLKSAIDRLEWIGEQATEYMRSIEVMRGVSTSISNLYSLTASYSKSKLGLKLISVVEKTLKACTVETEFKGIWEEGLKSIYKLLKSIKEETPKSWKKASEKIRLLLRSDLFKDYGN